MRVRFFTLVKSGSDSNTWVQIANFNTIVAEQEELDIVYAVDIGTVTGTTIDTYNPYELEVYLADGPNTGRPGALAVGSNVTTAWARRGVTESRELKRMYLLQFLSMHQRPTIKLQGTLKQNGLQIAPFHVVQDNAAVSTRKYVMQQWTVGLNNGEGSVVYRELIEADAAIDFLFRLQDIGPIEINFPIRIGLPGERGTDLIPNIPTFDLDLNGDVSGQPGTNIINPSAIVEKEPLDFTGFSSSQIVVNAVPDSPDTEAMTKTTARDFLFEWDAKAAPVPLDALTISDSEDSDEAKSIKIEDLPIAPSQLLQEGATTGQALVWDGAKYAPSSASVSKWTEVTNGIYRDGRVAVNKNTVDGVDGTIDTAFDPNANARVRAIAIQSDGKIVIGGDFISVGGTSRNRIARLNTDGSLDTGFDPNANDEIRAIAIQSDGKIVIGGVFTTVGGTTRNRIARLNTDGTLDTGFNPDANSEVNTIAIQSDGKIVIGGTFTTLGGVTRNRIARINTDGTLDTGFDPNASSTIRAIAIQSDGRIVIGGFFTTVGGVTRNNIARLNTDGSLDTGFDPNANPIVTRLAIQSDGKIVISGTFTTVGGVTRNRIARLNTDGTLDTGFNPNAGSTVNAITIQSDGKIIIGGFFTTVGGVTRNRIARLNTDGTLDTGFDPNAGGEVNAIAIQSDGKIVIGGVFTTVGGTTRNRIARLNFDPKVLDVNGVTYSDAGFRNSDPTGADVNTWRFGKREAGSVTPDGRIIVEINGVLYYIPAEIVT